ncbi:hypothetical protein [Xylanibacter ruminicola]|uniref:VirE N-terminal domain-containing protein n=1 Tax=Xylanibacter ruminicola TaxID=839 RepID=A0A1M6T4R6_XYLRU|nr:hypothetical protein [Xylanibacter ruminicola]SHK51963.1 hypothetical protein SAMN05216463_1057 [Xylanibacter ruminicola]
MINYVYTDRSGHKKARPVKNRKEYVAIRNTDANVKNFAAARAGDKKAKMALKQFNYNDLLPNGVLRGCHHSASTFAHDIDCGNEEECKEMAQRILAKKEEIGLLELSVSSGWGLHAVCRREPGKTILECQVKMAMATQTEMDTNAHDQARVLFTGPATDDVLLYLDDAIFDELLSEEQSAEEYQRLKNREKSGAEDVPAGAKKANKHYRPWETQGGPNERMNNGGEIKSFKGIPYEQIIEEWWRQNGGVPQEGERNVKLYQLAVSLRAICDNSKQLVLSVVPRLGLDDLEVERIVDSACKETPKGLSKAMQSVLSALGISNAGISFSRILNSTEQQQQMDKWLWEWGAQIEALFDDFPILKDICRGLKRNQYAAALFVSGGFMMTLMTRCKYSFYHRPEELRRLNCEVQVIGDPASGKSFATRLYKQLIAPIIAADRVGKEAINAYREQMKTKGANKEKPKKPKVAIRVHPARTSNAQFIQDMVNSVEEIDGEKIQLHMLTFDTELDNTMRVQKSGSWMDKESLELKAFHNEEDGQFYSNMDSIVENFVVTWNYVYTGTPLALKAKINERNFGSGLATRLTCIPLPPTNFEMISRERHDDAASDERLKEWGEKLDRMKGILSLDKIVDELYDWTARRMEDAKEDNSKAEEMLLKRCAYHGINFSAPFIVMRHWDKIHQDGAYYCGEFETDDVDWKLAELIVNIQYACQRHYFLALAEKYFDDQQREVSMNSHRKNKTYEGFSRLPEEFMVEDVIACFSLLSASAARMKIKRLSEDHLIEKIDDYVDNGTTKAIYKKIGIMV